MSEKTSKIKSIGSPTEYKNDKGTFYYFKIELENSDSGSIGSKENPPEWLAVGKELTYTLEETPQGNKIKKVNPNPQGGFKKPFYQEPIEIKIAGIAMRYSVDLVIGKSITEKQMIGTADTIYDWIIQKTPNK